MRSDRLSWIISRIITRRFTFMARAKDPSRKVSFFGLDLYCIHRSADEVLRYLDRVDPHGARAARKRLAIHIPLLSDLPCHV